MSSKPKKTKIYTDKKKPGSIIIQFSPGSMEIYNDIFKKEETPPFLSLGEPAIPLEKK